MGEKFFSCREWSIMDCVLATCSQFYYGDELLLNVLCRVFHRHAVVICKERYWCTFEPDESMDIYALLDCCDLHLVYLCPGIFAQLWLKKRCNIQKSPPEFPNWSKDELSENMGDKGFTSYNNFLPHHFQNPTNPVNEDNSGSKGGNKNTKGGNVHTIDKTSSNEPSSQETEITPVLPIHNPTSLISACLQIMVGSALRTVKPMSLFAECVDYMSWHPETHYPSGMKLPCSLQIHDKIAELQRISTLPHQKHLTVYHQVKLYDDVKVDSRVHDYLLEQALMRAY